MNILDTIKTERIIVVVLAVIVILSAQQTVSAAISVQEFGTDSNRYLAGTNIAVSGRVLNGTTGDPSADVVVTVYNTSWFTNVSTTAGSDGSFEATITAPDTEGSYEVIGTSAGVDSMNVGIIVYGAADIERVDITLTTGNVHVVTLSSSHGITSDMSSDTMTGGNVTIGTGEYYFLVSGSNIVYADNDNEINFSVSDSDGMSPIGNLKCGSKIKLDQTYTLAFVDNASQIVLMQKVAPVFTGAGSQNVTLLALDTSGSPVSGENLTLEVMYDNGTTVNSTVLAETVNGIVTTQITIQSNPGIYHIMVCDDGGDLGHLSYSVNTYDLYGEILSTDYDPQYTFASGQEMILAAYLKDASSGMSFNDTIANVTAEVRGSGYSQLHELTYDSDYGMFNKTVNVPMSLGSYNVEYTATIGTAEQRAYTTFNVRGYDIFLHPMCPERPDVEGFSPGAPGYIFIGGVDLSTGAEADVNGLTGESNKSKFSLTIKDSNGVAVTGEWGVMNLTGFFDAGVFVPPWVRDELERKATNASIINFTAPATTGVYDVTVSVNLNGTVEERSTGIGVQSIFVHGQPCASDGSFAPSVQQKSNVTMMIMAFDPKNMCEVPYGNITDAGLIEVYSEDGGEVVTEKMELVTFVSPVGSTNSAGVRFYVNDSHMGFHHVKFWINATIDGTPTTAVGEGFFETRLYYIWVSPATVGGVYKSFTSTSDVIMSVNVENSGHTAEEGLPVVIDEVRYCRNWEKIPFAASGNYSGTTDSNGNAELTIDATNPLKSGDYSVRVKVTGTNSATGETVYDYGNGWFEVRNFMLDIYPENWNVKTGGNVSFNVRAVNSTNMSSMMTTNLTLEKIVYRGDWNNPQRLVVEENAPLSPSQVTTNGTTSATVTYTGGNLTRSGEHEFIFEAEAGGVIETRRAWVYCEPYVAWAYTPGWDHRFGIGSQMSVLVEASDSWGGGNPHNITLDTNVTMVRKMGMFGDTPYKSRSDLTISVEEEASNRVNLTIDLTDWDEGEYMVTIKVVDNDGSEVFTDFWFQVELASVGLPEFYCVSVSDGNTHTIATSLNLTQLPSQISDGDGNYPDLNYSVATNSYIGKVCQQEGIQLLSDWELEWDREPFWALVNRTEPQTLYVNFKSANFSDETNTTLLHEGATLSELYENGTTVRRWNVTSVSSGGTVNLEGIDCLGSGYKIDTSVSKSGTFLIGEMWDCDWLKIDLDGDGSYMQEWQSGSGRYYVALADNKTAGVYDTVLVSNTTNFTDAIDASSGDDVTFGGDPILMVGLMYENSRYEVRFTSYHTGWGGMMLGTFSQGSVIKVPFLVQEPGGSVGISGASVVIDSLKQFSPSGISTTAISGVNGTTSTAGLAMLEINTTELVIPNGEYMIHYNVTLPAPYDASISPEEMWNLPMLQIRSFVIEANIGTVGNITVEKVSDGHGIDVVYGEELDAKGVTTLFEAGVPNVLRVGWPFDCEDDWYFNTSDGHYYDDFDGTNTSKEVANGSINLTRGDEVTAYNFTAYYPKGDSHTLNTYDTELCWEYWNITLVSTDGTDAELKVHYSPDNWDCTHTNVRNGSEIWWGPGPLEITITAITDTSITFESRSARALYRLNDLDILFDGNNANGELGAGRVTRANYSGYTLYAYNDVNETSEEQAWDWASSMDRVMVTNDTSTNIYRIGEDIPELDRYVAMAMSWGGKIILANSSLTHGIFPFCEWASDGDTYYTGTFTEEDVQKDLDNDWEINDTKTYYIRLDDTNPNGVAYPTEGKFDDDPDMTDVWTDMGPADMYGEEGGSGDIWSRQEQFVELESLWGWPFAIPEINISGDSATLTTFANREWEPFTTNDTVSMYVTAKTFANEPVTGNITVDQLIVMWTESEGDWDDEPFPDGGDDGMPPDGDGGTFPDDGMLPDGGDKMFMPTVYTNLTSNATMTGGAGVLEITYDELRSVVGNFTCGDFSIRINVTDTSGNSETAERFFMMDEARDDGGWMT